MADGLYHLLRELGWGEASARAKAVQQSIIEEEAEQLRNGFSDYTEAQVRQAIVHTRQDLIFMISALGNLSRQAVALTWLVKGLLVLMGLLLWRVW